MPKFGKDAQREEAMTKVVVCGDLACGKTCLLTRFIHDLYKDQYSPTMAVDFQCTILPTKEQIQIWEVSGNKKYGDGAYSYFQGATLIILCINLTDNSGLLDAKSRLIPINNL
jgi:GTPase SAR1 family protein